MEEEYVSAQQAATEQFVTLYKSIGGGWENYQTFPAIHQSQPAVIAAFKHMLISDDLQKE